MINTMNLYKYLLNGNYYYCVAKSYSEAEKLILSTPKIADIQEIKLVETNIQIQKSLIMDVNKK